MTATPPVQLSLCVETTNESLRFIGPLVRQFCREGALSEKNSADIELCVVEAVNNSFEHAYQKESGHRIDVALTLTPSEINIKVQDTGRKMNTDKMNAALPPAGKAAPGQPVPDKGRGVYIIHQLMNHVQFTASDQGNAVVMTKKYGASHAS